MADINNIEDVSIGSAAAFRTTLNSNFDILKEMWTGVYVGPEANESEAEQYLKVGGLWIVTEE